MSTIGVHNVQLRDLQCTVRDRKKRSPDVHVVLYTRPSGSKVSIGIVCLMQKVPPCTAMSSPTAHCPHRRSFQVIFSNRDRGELGGVPLQGMLLIVHTCRTKPLIVTCPTGFLIITHNPM